MARAVSAVCGAVPCGVRCGTVRRSGVISWRHKASSFRSRAVAVKFTSVVSSRTPAAWFGDVNEPVVAVYKIFSTKMLVPRVFKNLQEMLTGIIVKNVLFNLAPCHRSSVLMQGGRVRGLYSLFTPLNLFTGARLYFTHGDVDRHLGPLAGPLAGRGAQPDLRHHGTCTKQNKTTHTKTKHQHLQGTCARRGARDARHRRTVKIN